MEVFGLEGFVWTEERKGRMFFSFSFLWIDSLLWFVSQWRLSIKCLLGTVHCGCNLWDSCRLFSSSAPSWLHFFLPVHFLSLRAAVWLGEDRRPHLRQLLRRVSFLVHIWSRAVDSRPRGCETFFLAHTVHSPRDTWCGAPGNPLLLQCTSHPKWKLFSRCSTWSSSHCRALARRLRSVPVSLLSFYSSALKRALCARTTVEQLKQNDNTKVPRLSWGN